MLVVFGLPAALMLTLLVARSSVTGPPFAAQPGGTLAGRVAGEDGAPLADVPVFALLWRRGDDPRRHASTRTDDRGRFSIDVPPLDGCYLVRAGGGELQPVTVPVTLADGPAEPLELELLPAAALSVTVSRRDGRPVRGGSWSLSRREEGLLRLAPAAPGPSGTFDDDAFEAGGLAPGAWSLRVELDGGESALYPLELDAGRRDLRLDDF